MSKHVKHNMLKHIPWERRAEIAAEIGAMPDTLDRKILALVFIDGLSTAEVVRYCEENTVISRNHSPVSRRRVQQICVKYVPEYALKARPAGKYSKKRADHARIRDHAEKKVCAFCGRTEQLELHHMIPLFLGGTDDAANLVWLCTPCHAVVTSYQREHFKNEWYAESEVCANV